MGAMKCARVLMLELLLRVLTVQGQPSLSIEPATWYTGTTLTVTCDVTGLGSVGVFVLKGIAQIYSCPVMKKPCIDTNGLFDYSDVDWSQTEKAVFTISKANSSRDDGNWTCSGDTIKKQSKEIYLSIKDADCGPLNIDNGHVTYDNTTYGYTAKYTCDSDIEGNDTRICQANGSWSDEPPVCSDKKVLYWHFILVVIPCSGLVVVIIIVSGYKTLVISPLYVKVTKNTCQLSWKQEFKHVPDTTYAKCGPNGLTENAELIDGLFVVVFRDLIPERQHDVTVYCQHAEDMKLYKSETCVVFTLKDFSNAHPKERKPVLALQSLDLTVYQRKVELSWTSPIAFDSTKVEYWFGSEKNITMSANKTSLATSNAELTRLLPERMITFIIIGEKDGTKYPTGLLCQKTLKE